MASVSVAGNVLCLNKIKICRVSVFRQLKRWNRTQRCKLRLLSAALLSRSFLFVRILSYALQHFLDQRWPSTTQHPLAMVNHFSSSIHRYGTTVWLVGVRGEIIAWEVVPYSR